MTPNHEIEELEEIEIALDFYRGTEDDLKDTIEEMKAYQKVYENDQVSVVKIKESIFEDRKQYLVSLQVERDLNNLGRFYESEEEKLFGFDEDED